MTNFLKYLVPINLLILSACVTNPTLSYVSPSEIDLSGDWILDEDLSQTVVMVPSRGGQGKKSAPPRGGKGQRRDGQKGNGNGDRSLENEDKQREHSGQPASMTASQMKIEQGADGMGVAYPNRPYVDVDWGTAKVRRATINSGWTSDNALVISNESDQQKFTATYRLDSSAQILSITFSVNSFDGKRDFVRVFTRRQSD
jgi:hypothetical protein